MATIIKWLVIISIFYYGEAVPASKCPWMCACSFLEMSAQCSEARLNYIPPDLSPETKQLNLSLNVFETIPTIDLLKLPNISVLDLSQNQITELGENCMRGTYKLEELWLSSNDLSWKTIHPYVFTMNKNLKYLDLSGNLLKSVPREAYLVSDSLETLMLANCSIDALFSAGFSKLPKLKFLSLSHNRFMRIEGKIELPTVKTLDLSDCGIPKLEEDVFSEMRLLKKLVVSNNQLYNLLVDSDSLEYLEAEDCAMMFFDLGNMPNLTSIKLAGNKVQILYNKTFVKQPLLRYIDVSKNSIAAVDNGAFKKLEMLEFLNMSYNLISFIDPVTFSSNFRLKKLYLSHNYLSVLPRLESESITVMDLSSCEIEEMSRYSLQLMRKLKELDLSKNFLRKVSDNTESLSLEVLNLNTCRISHINNKTFAKMPNLHTVNLAGNDLSTAVNVSNLKNIQTIWASDNLWVCYCKSNNFQAFNAYLRHHAVDYNDMICFLPEEVRGFHFSKICLNGVEVAEEGYWPIIATVLTVSVILLCTGFTVKKYLKARDARQEEEAIHEENLRIRAEHHRNLIRQREQQLEPIPENRNAPDPRELQCPPSYAEALLLPRPETSSGNLGSQGSLAARKKRRRSRPRSVNSIPEFEQPSRNFGEMSLSDTEQGMLYYRESQI